MLNQIDDRRIGTAERSNQASHRESDWCVGEPAGRWDVSFGSRVAEKLKKWLGMEAAETPLVSKSVATSNVRPREGMVVRKAA